jgi:hypothetical protein
MSRTVKLEFNESEIDNLLCGIQSLSYRNSETMCLESALERALKQLQKDNPKSEE